MRDAYRTMVRVMVCVAALWAIGVGGCAINPDARLVEYRKDSPLPKFAEAQYDATYGLYATWDTDPIVKYPLNKGDQLGFEQDPDGTIVAVAGNNRYPLKTSMMVGKYYWARLR